MITNPEETGRLPEVIAEGAYYGMQTFDQALLQHVQAGPGLDGGRPQGGHPSARLQAARVLRRHAQQLGRVVSLRHAEEQTDAADARGSGANGAQPAVSGAPGGNPQR